MRFVSAALCITMLVTAGLAAQSQTSRDPIVILIDPPPPVPSLQVLVRRSPVIIVGVVERTGPPGLLTRGSSAVSRIQTIRVLDVLKGVDRDVRNAALIQLSLVGGTFVDQGSGQEYRTNADIEPMASGEEAVLFLRPRDNVSGEAATERVFQLSNGYRSFLPAVAGSEAYRLPPCWSDWPETSKKTVIQRDELLALLRGLISTE